MRKLLTLLAGVSALSLPMVPVNANAEITSLPEAINKAGRQRMLTQRMTKAYIMIGIDVDYFEAEKQLKQSIDTFNNQLIELEEFAPTKQISEAIVNVQNTWLPILDILDLPNSKENAALLLEKNDELLRLSHKIVLMLQDLSGTEQGRLVNIAGRQRMLSQRLAKFYMARMWGFSGAEINDETQRAQNEFKGALQELVSSKSNTTSLKRSLVEADQQWRLFENALEKKQQKIPLIIARNSEKLLKNMNKITGMYADLK